MYCFLKKFANGLCAVSYMQTVRDCADCKKAPESPKGFPAREKEIYRIRGRVHSRSLAALRIRRMRAFWSAYIS